MKTLGAFALALTISAPFSAALADDITDEMDGAKKAYLNGDVQGALEAIRLVEAWLLERVAEGLTAVFGDLPGWEKEVGEGQAAGAAFMGGGVSASCTYRNGDETIESSALGQSPMLSMAMSMISNPMIASSSGGKIIKVAGHKALIKQSGSRWELTLPFQNTVLIDIKASTTREDAIAAAEVIDYDKLASVMTAQ